MKKIAILTCLLLLFLKGYGDDTTRKGPLRPRITTHQAATTDTITIAGPGISPDSIAITSYDKPLRSMRETFFVTNHHHSMSMLSITLQFTYRRHDNGEMLHSRTATIAANIPPGETRQLYVTSWDRQYSYYHHATRIRPRSPKAVAYDVDISAVSVSLSEARLQLSTQIPTYQHLTHFIP